MSIFFNPFQTAGFNTRFIDYTQLQTDIDANPDGLGPWMEAVFPLSPDGALPAYGITGAIGTINICFDCGNGLPNANAGVEDRTYQIDNLTISITDPTLSVSEFSKSDVSDLVTSSNPVSSTIELDAKGDYSIINITGQTAQTGSFDGSVNVEGLPTGIYFLAIEGGTYKFVKK